MLAHSVLAVDLGKTGCRVRLWAGEVCTEAEGRGSPGLAAADGAGLALGAILQVAAPLLREAGLSRVDAVGVGAAGALADAAAAQALAARLASALPAGRVAVTSDAVTSQAGALGGRFGVVLAIGTGAIALGVRPDGVTTRADGWGPWLGDEGGGAWLGLQGLRAAMRAFDGRGPATSLRDAAERRFGYLATLAGQLEGSANAPRFAAQFAPDVVKAAEAGDWVAAGLLEQAGAALAGSVWAASAGWPEGVAVPVVITGGLAKQAGLITALRIALAEGDCALSVCQAQASSLDGARLLATDADTVHELSVHRVAGRRVSPAHALDQLATEGVRAGLDDLDLRSAGAVVRLVVEAERAAQGAVAEATDALAGAADLVAARMAAGGRLFYLGAGTPGRLAVLDAAELGPTYSAPPGLVIALLAGGPGAMLEAAEGAEDDSGAAVAALERHGVSAGDAVVGIAASGRTPFVVGGLSHARSRGALTVAIVNNAGSPAAAAADCAVEILTGAEVVAGSTRMTAGTTQKIALNALSTAVMVSLGKTYGARMVDLRATNDKLRRRAQRIVQDITGVAPDEAAAALAASEGRVKPAVVALLAGVDVAEAVQRLARSGGRVRDAIRSVEP